MCLINILGLNLFQFVLQSTRGQNILDLILSNSSYAVENVNMNDLISDHCIVSADLVMPIMMTDKKQKTIRDFKNGDYDAFNKYLQTLISITYSVAILMYRGGGIYSYLLLTRALKYMFP